MLTQWLTRAADLLLPPACLRCQAAITQQGGLCAECFAKIAFISGSVCAQCGIPFELPVEAAMRCGRCLAEPPAFDAARAVCRYDEHSRPLVTRLKYSDQLHLAPTLARWMLRAGAPLLPGTELLLPVPLHYRRQVRRMHNQSALLARKLAELAELPFHPRLLIRHKFTTPQTGLTRAQRAKNVQSAFSLHPKYQDSLHGKHVLLIDDVLTTGATLHACAKTLKAAGAASVKVLTFARTCLD